MIRKRRFHIIAIALLCASPVLADVGNDQSDGLVLSDSRSLLNSYRFTEGELARIENASVTAGTVLRQSNRESWVGDSHVNTAVTLPLGESMLEWVGSDSRIRSVSIEENISSPARKVRIDMPIVGTEHVIEGVENQIEERLDTLVNAI